jgi:hypothetical protein
MSCNELLKKGGKDEEKIVKVEIENITLNNMLSMSQFT